MHYGLLFNIGDYKFDKHWFHGFNPLACPPFPGGTSKPLGGVLPHPPRPSELPPGQGLVRMQHLYAAVTVTTLNEAFCELHLKRCPRDDELLETCREVGLPLAALSRLPPASDH